MTERVSSPVGNPENRETSNNPAETAQALEDLHQESIQNLQEPPLDAADALENVELQGSPLEGKYAEIQAAMKGPDYLKVGEILLEFFLFGDTVEGTGARFSAAGKELLDNFSAQDSAKMLDQLGSTDPDLKQKFKQSYLSAHLQQKLWLGGYEPMASVPNEGLEILKVSETGKTLQSIIKEKFPQKGKEICDQINNEEIIGALFFEEKVPAPSYLYFSPQGYPVWISHQADDQPKYKLWEKTADEREDSDENKIEFLESRLQPGDIIFLSHHEQYTSDSERLKFSVARSIQGGSAGNDWFPTAHVAVYKGEGKVAQIGFNQPTQDAFEARKELSLAQLSKDYGGLTVGRLPSAAASLQAEFGKKVIEYIRGVKSYSNQRVEETVFANMKGEASTLPTDTTKLICTDPVRLAARDMFQQHPEMKIFEQIASANMAIDMFQALDAPLSFEIPEINT